MHERMDGTAGGREDRSADEGRPPGPAAGSAPAQAGRGKAAGRADAARGRFGKHPVPRCPAASLTLGSAGCGDDPREGAGRPLAARRKWGGRAPLGRREDCSSVAGARRRGAPGQERGVGEKDRVSG